MERKLFLIYWVMLTIRNDGARNDPFRNELHRYESLIDS